MGNLDSVGVVKMTSRKRPFYFLFSEAFTDEILSSLVVILLSSVFFVVKLKLNPLFFLLMSEFPPIMFTEYLS